METKDLATIADSVQEFTTATSTILQEVKSRLLCIEQKITAPTGGYSSDESTQSIGHQVANSPQVKAMLANNATAAASRLRLRS